MLVNFQLADYSSGVSQYRDALLNAGLITVISDTGSGTSRQLVCRVMDSPHYLKFFYGSAYNEWWICFGMQNLANTATLTSGRIDYQAKANLLISSSLIFFSAPGYNDIGFYYVKANNGKWYASSVSSTSVVGGTDDTSKNTGRMAVGRNSAGQNVGSYTYFIDETGSLTYLENIIGFSNPLYAQEYFFTYDGVIYYATGNYLIRDISV